MCGGDSGKEDVGCQSVVSEGVWDEIVTVVSEGVRGISSE